MADRIIVPVQPGYDQVFRSPTGVVGRNLDQRAARVQHGAARQAGEQSGALRTSMSREWTSRSGDILTIRVGSNVGHALVHHRGARPHVIRATRAKALRYINKRGQVVFARQVFHPGHRPNEYLTDNLHLAVE